MRLYHFTSEHHLPSILAEGVLRTTDPNLFATGPASFLDDEGVEHVKGGPLVGQAVVWLLDVPTARSGDHGLTSSVDKAGIRITVEVRDASPWLHWLTARRHDPEWVRAIIQTGGGKHSARHWYVVPRPIPRSEWTEVRNMRTGEGLG